MGHGLYILVVIPIFIQSYFPDNIEDHQTHDLKQAIQLLLLYITNMNVFADSKHTLLQIF